MKTFENIEKMQEYIRTDFHDSYMNEKSYSLDNINVDGIDYVMSNYDQSGRNTEWKNYERGETILMTTENRYKHGYADAEMELFEF